MKKSLLIILCSMILALTGCNSAVGKISGVETDIESSIHNEK